MRSVFYYLMKVLIPTDTFSKCFTVPEYEVPILQSLWGPHVKAGEKIDVMYLGSNQRGVDPADMQAVQEEYNRLRALYRHPEGQIAADAVFGSLVGFQAHLRTVAKDESGELDQMIASGGPKTVKPQEKTNDEKPQGGGSEGGGADEGEDAGGGDSEPDDLERMVASGHLDPKMAGRITDALRTAGFDDADGIMAVSDEILLAVSWVTPNTLPQVRAAAAAVVAGA